MQCGEYCSLINLMKRSQIFSKICEQKCYSVFAHSLAHSLCPNPALQWLDRSLPLANELAHSLTNSLTHSHTYSVVQ